MNQLLSFRIANTAAINKGELIYIAMAQEAGIEPRTALNSISALLSSPWIEIDHFLADLGNNDPLARTEAQSHFGLNLL